MDLNFTDAGKSSLEITVQGWLIRSWLKLGIGLRLVVWVEVTNRIWATG